MSVHELESGSIGKYQHSVSGVSSGCPLENSLDLMLVFPCTPLLSTMYTLSTSFPDDSQLNLAARHKNTSWSVLLDLKPMAYIWPIVSVELEKQDLCLFYLEIYTSHNSLKNSGIFERRRNNPINCILQKIYPPLPSGVLQTGLHWVGIYNIIQMGLKEFRTYRIKGCFFCLFSNIVLSRFLTNTVAARTEQ